MKKRDFSLFFSALFSCGLFLFNVYFFPMNNLDLALVLQKLSYSFIPVLLGIILHEVAHGYTAYRRGDPTAMMLGRITLNPVPHIDPMGLIVFIFTALFSPFVFGWAKPVPINPRYFKNIRKDIMLVSAAGPMANFFLACFFAVLLKLLLLLPVNVLNALGASLEFLLNMCTVGIWANIGLMWLNLVPIPPLDGSKLLMGVLPAKAAYKFAELERYGMLILMLLIFTGLFSYIIMPFIQATTLFIITIFGLN